MQPNVLSQEDDIDICIDEVNKVVGGTSFVASADGSVSAASKPILSIEHRFDKRTFLLFSFGVAVWCSGSTLVTIKVVILHRAWLVLEWVTSLNRVRTLSVFNQPPRPTQPGHPSGVGKMSTGVKTGKLTAGYAVIRRMYSVWLMFAVHVISAKAAVKHTVIRISFLPQRLFEHADLYKITAYSRLVPAL